MKAVTIYTTPTCPFCVRAKRLLDRKGVQYQEINVAYDDDARAQLAERTGRQTVPQIFIGDEHVGGSDELYALDASGKLDPMLH